MGCQMCQKHIARNAIFVYPPLIYKYDTDLAKYLPLYIRAGYINWGQIYIYMALIYISDTDI